MHSSKRTFLLLALGALLCLGACSPDLYRVSDDFQIDLGVAHADRQDKIHLLLDNGYKIYPEDCDYVFETGKRYKLHYSITANRSSLDSVSWYAKLVDVFPIQMIPLMWNVEPWLMIQPQEAVTIDRFWLGGGFLNVSLNYNCQDHPEYHRFRLVNQGFSHNTLTVELRHYAVGDGTGPDQASVTLSFPLASMLYFPEADVLTVRVTESNKKGNMVVRSYDLPGGRKQR